MSSTDNENSTKSHDSFVEDHELKSASDADTLPMDGQDDTSGAETPRSVMTILAWKNLQACL